MKPPILAAMLLMAGMAGCCNMPTDDCHYIYHNANFTAQQFGYAVENRQKNDTLETEREVGNWYGQNKVWTGLYYQHMKECNGRWTDD